MPSRSRLFAGIFATALATLLLEIALVRVLSYTIWFHFAYVVISTALLGFGASGSLLTVLPSIGQASLERTLGRCAALAGLSALVVLVMVHQLPFDPIDVVRDPKALAILILYQCVSAAPFLFAGLTVSLALRAGAREVDRLYFWDLVGAGLGCLLAIPLMGWVSPPGALIVSSGVFLCAAAVFLSSGRARFVLGALGLVVAAGATAAPMLTFEISPSKSLRGAVEELKMVPVFHRWTGLFATDAVQRTAESTWRSGEEWGLSKTVPGGADKVQRAWGLLTHDGSAGAQIFDRREGDLAFLDSHILSIPYRVAPPKPEVLVIGVGGGKDIYTALRYGAAHITGVELDPVTVELVRDFLPQLHEGRFSPPLVNLVAAEGRHFIRRTDQKFDLIQITGVDTLAATSSGMYLLSENYLYTVEAFEDFLGKLKPGGLLSIAAGIISPDQPHSTGKMVTVARQALLERGVTEPERHIVAISSRYLLSEVMVRNEPFDPQQLQVLEQEVDRLAFDPLLLGGRSLPLWKELATLPEGPARDALYDRLPHVLRPARDDNPFFFHFFRWRDLLSASDFRPWHTTALSQAVLGVLLLTLSILAIAYIVVPLLIFRRRGAIGMGSAGVGLLAYFAALGVGFMMFEVSLIQRLTLYLGYPTYALTVVLSVLLTFLGFGSFLSRRWVGRERRIFPMAVLALCLLAIFYMYALPHVEAFTLRFPLVARIALTVAMLAPLGLVLGMFLPLGIRYAESLHPDLVPWAWAVNGCTSVTSTVLTVVLAMEVGFSRVWLVSLGVYVVGVMALLGTWRSPAAGRT